MRYGADLTKRILELLKETPNIRYVCMKTGIHHATFYRWMMYHPEFSREVMYALFLVRNNFSDLSESIIMKKIQNGDMTAAKFFLVHNSPRYMTRQKENQYRSLLQTESGFISTTELSKEITKFEDLFKPYSEMEQYSGSEIAKALMEPALKLTFHNDDELIDLFFDSYEDWKKTNQTHKNNKEVLEETMKDLNTEAKSDIEKDII